MKIEVRRGISTLGYLERKMLKPFGMLGNFGTFYVSISGKKFCLAGDTLWMEHHTPEAQALITRALSKEAK